MGFGTRWTIRNGQGEAEEPDKDLNLAYTCSQESYKSYQSSWHPKSWLLGLPDPLEEKKHSIFRQKCAERNAYPDFKSPFLLYLGANFDEFFFCDSL